MDRSARQRAQNEATFREANERLADKVAELGYGDERTPYLCECENERCTELIALSRPEYEQVRADPRRFVVVAGHHQPSYDEVIQEKPEFTIIDKTGEEGDLVEAEDSRSASSRSSSTRGSADLPNSLP